MNVLVTGATGFVGSHVVPQLLAAGHEVRALVRDPAKAAGRLDSRVAVHQGDICHGASVRTAVAGAEAVVHLAAHLGGGSRRENIATSGEGARTVAAAAAEAGAERFVHMSSMAVYRDIFGRHDESAAVGPLYPYGVGKLAGERAVQDVAATRGLRTFILRPPPVYGEGRRGTDWTRTFARMLGRGRLLPLPLAGDFVLSMIHVETLAAACAAALQTEAQDTVLNVCDARPVRFREIVATYREVTGRGPRVIDIPGLLMRVVGSPLELFGRRPLVARLREGVVLDAGRATHELDVDFGAHFFLDALRQYLAGATATRSPG
jgi:nucleoside-diphosphate-sugar epimerase